MSLCNRKTYNVVTQGVYTGRLPDDINCNRGMYVYVCVYACVRACVCVCVCVMDSQNDIF